MPSNYRTLIDYVSISVEHSIKWDNDISKNRVQVLQYLRNNQQLSIFIGGHEARTVPASKPFRFAMELGTVRVQWHNYLSDDTSRLHVQIPGTACAYASENQWLDTLARYANHVTRLDLAMDIETDVRPLAFVEKMTKTARTRGTKTSETGETEYVGSRSSERFVRVYRYNEPHPRAALMRIEYECKGKGAKGAAHAVLDYGIRRATFAYGDKYGWTHDAYPVATDVPTLPPAQPDNGNANTVRWLLTKVAPSLKRTIQSGSMTLEQFLQAAELIEE